MATQPTTPIDWAEQFKKLVDEVIRNNEVSIKACEAISNACQNDVSPCDAPGEAIAKIVEANNDLKIKALKLLQTVIWVSEGREDEDTDD